MIIGNLIYMITAIFIINHLGKRVLLAQKLHQIVLCIPKPLHNRHALSGCTVSPFQFIKNLLDNLPHP